MMKTTAVRVLLLSIWNVNLKLTCEDSVSHYGIYHVRIPETDLSMTYLRSGSIHLVKDAHMGVILLSDACI